MWEVKYTKIGLFLLSFDLSQASDEAAAAFQQTARDILLFSSPTDSPMPLDRFITLYYVSSSAGKDDGMASLRAEVVAKGFGVLKDGYHKKSVLDPQTMEKYRISNCPF